VSGNLGVSGGGVSFYFRRRAAFDLAFIHGEAAAPRTIVDPLTGPGILAARDPAIRMVWVTAANPVAMLPESRTVRRALLSRELTVVVDSFLTDTARAAHIVLPTTTMLEDDDLLGAYGHHWLAASHPVVPPPSGVKTDHEIVQALAGRVGLGEAFAPGPAEWKERLLRRVAPRGVTLDALTRGAVRNPEAPRVLFENRVFATRSGRVNLVRSVIPQPPVPPADRPLLLLAMSVPEAQSSQWRAGAQEGPAPAIVHPASAPGFADGALARVESELGAMVVRLVFDASQRRDVVILQKGGWLSAGRCANALIPARATDAGGCAVYYDTPVRLAPISP